MHYRAVAKILGVIISLFSLSLLPPLGVSVAYGDGSAAVFALSALGTLALGLCFWYPVRRNKEPLGVREGFLTVAAFWISLVTAGTLPFVLSDGLNVSFTDAFFESMSGLTTTGATVFRGLEEMPVSILYYRQQLQWLGGMGIVVLAIAVIPILGIGGMQMYLAEMPGATKESKLTPRIKETAKALWLIYVAMTIICAFVYRLAGMSWFDAITHSYSTIAIGGFSTHDTSFAYFDNDLILSAAIVFMVLAGINFSLHFTVLDKLHLKHFFREIKRNGKRKQQIRYFRTSINALKDYFYNTELRVYAGILIVSAVIVCTVLVLAQVYATGWESIKHGLFQVVSIATTSGFTTADFADWPLFLPALLLATSIVGGCIGSTAGGLKVMRVVLLFKQGRREIVQLIHPDGIFPIMLNNKPVAERIINSVWGFFALYVVSFVALALVLQATGLDLTTAYSTVTACLNNLGPALGAAQYNYADLPASSKWVLAFTMMLGRLELLALLILLTPRYWRD